MHGFCAPHITSNWRNTMEYIIYTPPKTNIEVESGPGISPNGFREASQLVINNLKDCFSLTKLAKESWKLPSPAPHHHPHWVPTGTQWIQQAPNGSNRPPMDPTGPQLCLRAIPGKYTGKSGLWQSAAVDGRGHTATIISQAREM